MATAIFPGIQGGDLSSASADGSDLVSHIANQEKSIWPANESSRRVARLTFDQEYVERSEMKVRHNYGLEIFRKSQEKTRNLFIAAASMPLPNFSIFIKGEQDTSCGSYLILQHRRQHIGIPPFHRFPMASAVCPVYVG